MKTIHKSRQKPTPKGIKKKIIIIIIIKTRPDVSEVDPFVLIN